MKLFLNEDVKEEVLSSELLFIAYFFTYSPYDSEIDPLHNPDWVKMQSKYEVEKLKEVKKELEKIKEYYKKEKL